MTTRVAANHPLLHQSLFRSFETIFALSEGEAAHIHLIGTAEYRQS